MAFNNSRYVPYAVHIKSITAWINQIKSTALSMGVSLFEETTGSQTDRAFVASRAIDPTVAISTTDLVALATMGFGGVSWTGATAVPAEIYARELPLGGVPTAVGTTNHIRCSISDGLLVPISVSGSHNSVATLNFMLHALLGSGVSSGARPFVFTSGVAIDQTSSPEPATNNIFVPNTIHYASGASSPAVSPRLVQGILDMQINFGISVQKEATDSDVYPNYASIIGRMPSIEFTVRDLALDIEVGDGIATTGFDAYFQAVATNGQRTAKGTGAHVKFTGTTGMITPGSLNLGHKVPAGCSFTYTPAAASPCLAISTTSTIPTVA